MTFDLYLEKSPLPYKLPGDYTKRLSAHNIGPLKNKTNKQTRPIAPLGSPKSSSGGQIWYVHLEGTYKVKQHITFKMYHNLPIKGASSIKGAP